MKILSLSHLSLSVSAAASLAACGGSQPPIGAPGAMPQSSVVATHAVRLRPSWMNHGAKRDDLLYITNNYSVTVYAYPSGKLVGTLKGFYRPQGECVDASGNVFIADGNTVQEYAHAGTKSIRSFSLSGYASVSCAVNLKTNDLAITWEAASSGTIAVYHNETGTPTLYTNGDMVPTFCGYDNDGNLFVDGVYGSGTQFAFAELPSGGSGLENITVDQSVGYPGAVQWDGKYVAVGDQQTQAIYRFAIAGSTGTLKGTVSLGDAYFVIQWCIEGKKVVGSDEQEPDTTYYWSYPAGGQPVKTLQLKDIGAPFAATISKAPR